MILECPLFSTMVCPVLDGSPFLKIWSITGRQGRLEVSTPKPQHFYWSILAHQLAVLVSTVIFSVAHLPFHEVGGLGENMRKLKKSSRVEVDVRSLF